MLKSYKYCLLPSQEQKNQLVHFFGGMRFIYNLGLETKISAWSSNRQNLSCFDLHKQLTELKATDATWLQECPAQALQMSLRNLDNAYTQFFKGKGFPKFKNKHSRQSIQFPQKAKINFEKSTVWLPKLGNMNCVFHRQFKGTIKTVTVSKTTTDKYFVSILVDNQVELPKKKPITEQGAVGIDLGIKTLAVLSDGTEFENPKWVRVTKANLRRQQRSFSRKKDGSKNKEKQRLVVARSYEKVVNQRKDYIHKLTTQIVKNYDTICVENLNVTGMLKNKKLSFAIAEVGWAEFKEMLEYKTTWYGKNFIVIGRFEPSSKLCSVCGTLNKELKLQHRTWQCEKCKTTHDRDVNAAINIRNFGLRCKPSTVNVSQ